MTHPQHAADANERLSSGFVAPGFEAVRHYFDRSLLSDPGYSAQVVASVRGRTVVDLHGGADLVEDSVTGVFSASKGVAALVLGGLVSEGLLDLDERVVAYWPEFGAQGKSEVTVRQLLSHQAGLVNVVGGLSIRDLFESERGAAKLAASAPVWRPGAAFGYHGLTIGVFMEELVRRVTGETLQSRYEARIRAPRDIDFYLGFPEAHEHRWRELQPMTPSIAQQADMESYAAAPDGLTALMYNQVDRDLTVELSPRACCLSCW